MHAFYSRLADYLFHAGLEKSTAGLGCSEEEIAAAERTYGVRFPLAYRLFQRWCGRASLSLLNNQDFTLASLDYSWGSARELLAENQETLEPGAFVFGEWQGYSFYYFVLGPDNPPVKLCIIKSDVEPGLLVEERGRFTDWLVARIKDMVRICHSGPSTSVHVPAVLAELDRIAQLADGA